MDRGASGESADMKGGQYGFGETSWAAGSWGVAPAMRDGGAGSSGSEQHRAAQQDARGTKRPAYDEDDSAEAEEPGVLTAEAKQRKAHREKARRVNLNGLFHELAVLLDKDHPKAEKAGIVIDAAKMIKALKEEIDGLKHRNVQLERLNHMLMSASGTLLQQQTAAPHIVAAAQQLQVPVQVTAPLPAPVVAPVVAPLVEQPPALVLPAPGLPSQQPLPPAKSMAYAGQAQQSPVLPWWDLPFMFGEISEIEDSLLRPPVA